MTFTPDELHALVWNMRFMLYSGAALAFALSAFLNMNRTTRWIGAAVFALIAAGVKYLELHP